MPDKKRVLSEEQRIKARVRNRKWREENPDRVLEQMERTKKLAKTQRVTNPDKFRAIKLKHRYGISIEDYEAMHREQNGSCSICGRVNERFAVDHCHSTGTVRGLLCGTCNRALGLLEDRPDWLIRAAEYLNASR